MRLLVVDDEKEFLELMMERLQKRNFTVSTASSGEEALKLIKVEPFDAVILDVKMPGMDGIETLKAIKASQPGLAVLLLSGHASVDSAMQGVESGAVDYLLKPIQMNDLIMRLHDIEEGKKDLS